MVEFPIFLINLDSSDARLASASAALAEQEARFTRLSAFDGRDKDPHSIQDYSSTGARAVMGRDLNGGEIGCYFSHIHAAQAFLETGADFGMVLEDDAAPTPQAIALVQALAAWQMQRGDPDWHLCHLGNPRMKYLSKIAEVSAQGETRTIARAHYFPVTTSALLWTRKGAQAFLDVALPMTAPVDHVLRSWLTRTNMGIAVTPPVFMTTNATSDIDTAARKRKTEGRTPLYGWLKAKRMYGDKWRAWRHMRAHARAAK